VRHRKDPSFQEYYDNLPPDIRERTDKSFALISANPRHPSLHFKCIRDDLWSVRVGRSYRPSQFGAMVTFFNGSGLGHMATTIA